MIKSSVNSATRDVALATVNDHSKQAAYSQLSSALGESFMLLSAHSNASRVSPYILLYFIPLLYFVPIFYLICVCNFCRSLFRIASNHNYRAVSARSQTQVSLHSTTDRVCQCIRRRPPQTLSRNPIRPSRPNLRPVPGWTSAGRLAGRPLGALPGRPLQRQQPCPRSLRMGPRVWTTSTRRPQRTPGREVPAGRRCRLRFGSCSRKRKDQPLQQTSGCTTTPASATAPTRLFCDWSEASTF